MGLEDPYLIGWKIVLCNGYLIPNCEIHDHDTRRKDDFHLYVVKIKDNTE